MIIDFFDKKKKDIQVSRFKNQNSTESLEVLFVYAVRSNTMYKSTELTPPQFKVRERSFPVPRGMMATGGGGLMPRLSISDRIQPTVPSPPHAKIRRLGTFLYNSRLQRNNATAHVIN